MLEANKFSHLGVEGMVKRGAGLSLFRARLAAASGRNPKKIAAKIAKSYRRN